ncbi:MAG: Gfo/Idh/MocA family oxidoreductase [Thermofilaceae archaeon]
MRVKIGIVGLGNQGILHVEALKSIQGAELVAVADINAEKAKSIADEYKIPRYYTNVKELCEDPEVEAVIVATPDHLHLEPVLEALKAGKHVFVEKPMATKSNDAELMCAESRRRDLILMVNFENRFNPPFMYIKELLERGEIGSPLYAYIRLSDTIYVPKRMLSWASQTNVAYFLMSHTADLACWYFRRKVCEVYAVSVCKVLSDLNTPDAVGALLKFDEEGFALLESGWVLPESSPSIFDFKLELVGSEGTVHINAESEGLTVTSKDKLAYPHVAKFYKLRGTVTGFLRKADEHFIECVSGRAAPLIKAEEGIENTRIIEAVIKSSLKGGTVKL